MEKTLFSPLVWNFYGINFSLLFLFFPLGVIIYLFSLWAKFKGEYPEKMIISYSLFTLLFFALFALLPYFLGQKEYFLAVGLSGVIVSSIIASWQNKWNIWYMLESITPAILFLSGIILLGMSITFGRVSYFIQTLFFLIAYLSVKLAKGYRSFNWYRSGKAGFLFLLPLSIILVLEAGLDFSLSNGLYWRSLLSAAGATAGSVLLFYRARNIKK
ncbi:MAG: hypothetical protein ABIB61_00490 [Candidatus Shapirobacteria bacterium]